MRRLSLRLMHTPPMRVRGLGLGLELELSRAYGWVGISQRAGNTELLDVGLSDY